ncbi:hypothetical protein TNCV_3905371 [Trichonephila clavipes]|nr:hypothetical protein TNCV_3905371 [Trichonephila clavipes]
MGRRCQNIQDNVYCTDQAYTRVWVSSLLLRSPSNLLQLERVQLSAARIITGLNENQNRNSEYLCKWKSNQRLKKNSPFSLADKMKIISQSVEHTSTGPALGVGNPGPCPEWQP